MASSNTKLFDITDANATTVSVLERRVSDWQRELRITIRGKALESNLRPDARNQKSVTIKKPDELEDLSLKLKEFLGPVPLSRMALALLPHKRLAGMLRRDVHGIVWELNSYGEDRCVRVDEATLEDLVRFADSYE